MSLEFDSSDFDPMDESGADEGESSWMDAAIDREPFDWYDEDAEQLDRDLDDRDNDREPTEHELNRYTHGHFDY